MGNNAFYVRHGINVNNITTIAASNGTINVAANVYINTSSFYTGNSVSNTVIGPGTSVITSNVGAQIGPQIWNTNTSGVVGINFYTYSNSTFRNEGLFSQDQNGHMIFRQANSGSTFFDYFNYVFFRCASNGYNTSMQLNETDLLFNGLRVNFSGQLTVGNSTVNAVVNSTALLIGSSKVNNSTLSVGSNLSLSTTALSIGNSTQNVFVNSSVVSINGTPISSGGGGKDPTIQVFTSSDTWTKPANCKRIKIIITGGGSGGSGGITDCAFSYGGSPGASGGTVIGVMNVESTSTVSVTIGAGGAGGVGYTGIGSNGGASSFSSFTANGGISNSSVYNGPSIGGAASGGSINIKGSGQGAIYLGGSGTAGAPSYWGGGGISRGGGGANAEVYGSGGGAGIGNYGGGYGASGVCYIEEYY